MREIDREREREKEREERRGRQTDRDRESKKVTSQKYNFKLLNIKTKHTTNIRPMTNSVSHHLMAVLSFDRHTTIFGMTSLTMVTTKDTGICTGHTQKTWTNEEKSLMILRIKCKEWHFECFKKMFP